jgi:protein-L-isoaspartate O-methyltransferase
MEAMTVLAALAAARAVLHLGALHGYEKALVALIAFGPFLVLFLVVHVVRRRDRLHEAGDPED